MHFNADNNLTICSNNFSSNFVEIELKANGGK